MSNILQFNYSGRQVRTVSINGEPWFVLADLCAVLGLANVGNVAARVDEVNIRQADVENTRGQNRQTLIVSESGMYEVVLRSDKAEAVAFRRWITSEVLPEIRKTGTYGTPALTGPALLAAAVLEAQTMIDAQAETIRELEPAAKSWKRLADANGDHDVRDAAQILARAGAQTGQRRLFQTLRDIGWLDRGNRPYQDKVDQGLVREKLSTFEIPRSNGGVQLAKPQVRITPKGLGKLHHLLGVEPVSEGVDVEDVI